MINLPTIFKSLKCYASQFNNTSKISCKISSKIKVALRDVVKLAFRHSKCNYISIYNKSFAWVKKPRKK